MTGAATPNRCGGRYLLPVPHHGDQCESAFSYLLCTAKPEDTINVFHVVMKPDPNAYDTNVEIPSFAVLFSQGEELCDEYRERVRKSGLDTGVWFVLSDNVAKEVIFWSNILGIGCIVIGLNLGY